MRITISGKLPADVGSALVTRLVVGACAAAKRRRPGAVAIAVTDDRTVRRLNRMFRGKDKTTDVLSFSYGDEVKFPAGPVARERRGGERTLGDIVISLPKVRRQARDNSRSVKDEFALMVVHGTLHLLGYDHERVKDEKAMFALQHKILARILGW
ncbi:rRNA maturation RNase YbeY [Candidatus Uhrbacteria bacterium]|nr:rRNA maturation RNase YbeY [Candidatus Uhrbacteria bacterium]